MHRAAAVALLLGCAACGPPDLGFALALTLRFDSGVGDAAIATVKSYELVATGDEGYDATLPLARPAARQEGLIYRPGTATRQLTVSVLAKDDAGAVVASGTSGALALAAQKTREVEIDLSSGATVDLGGLDLASGDLAGVDLSGLDLSSGDLASPCGSGQFCEGFERGLLQWNAYANGATGVVDGSRAHTGTHSYHVTFPPVTTGSLQYASLVSEASWVTTAGADFWVRVFLYVDSAPYNNVSLFGVRQGGAPNLDLTLLRIGGGELYIKDEPDSVGIGSGAMLVNGGWRCIELHAIVAASGTAQVAVDGTAGPTSFNGNLVHAPPFALISIAASIGSASADDTDSHEMWFDDLVASPTRVGCD